MRNSDVSELVTSVCINEDAEMSDLSRLRLHVVNKTEMKFNVKCLDIIH